MICELKGIDPGIRGMVTECSTSRLCTACASNISHHICLIIHTRSLGIEPGVLATVDTNATFMLHYLMSSDNSCVSMLMTNTKRVIRIRS